MKQLFGNKFVNKLMVERPKKVEGPRNFSQSSLSFEANTVQLFSEASERECCGKSNIKPQLIRHYNFIGQSYSNFAIGQLSFYQIKLL